MADPVLPTPGWLSVNLEWPWDPGLLLVLNSGVVRSLHYELEILVIQNRCSGGFDDGEALHIMVVHHTLLWKDWMWKKWMQGLGLAPRLHCGMVGWFCLRVVSRGLGSVALEFQKPASRSV